MRQVLPLGPCTRRLVRPALVLLPAVVLLGLVAATLEGAGIGLMLPLLGAMTHATGEPQGRFAQFFQGVAGGLDPQARFTLLATIIVVLVLAKNAVAAANGVLSAWVYGRASHAVRSGLAARLTQVGFGFFGQQSPGKLLNVLAAESWRASDAIGIALIIAVNGTAIAILFLFLCLLSWKMTVAVGIGLASIQLAQAALSAPLRRKSRRVTENNGRLASSMLHLIDGARLIRFFGQGQLERDRFDRVSDGVRRELFALERRRSFLQPAMEGLYSVLFVAVVFVSWRARIPFAEIATFVVLLYRMQPNVRNIQSASAQLQSLNGSLEAVEWLLDPSGKPAESSGELPAPAPRRAIRFEDVSFRFPGQVEASPVLQGVSFTLRAGRSTALVGRSGAGKTTIINLLCRFLEPDAGAIWIDGAPLSAVDTASWRARLSLASQDLDLVEGSVAENIAYGRPDAGPEDIERAARMADAHAFIAALPQSYDTPVGHRGAHLSAGQRQRVALARALVRDPDVLILDEATNAVDGISEQSIIETLKSRAGRGTTIVVSHHRKTLSFCDDVVILGGGSVSDSVPLDSLGADDMETLYARHSAA